MNPNRALAAAVVMITLSTSTVTAHASDQTAIAWQTDLDQVAYRAQSEGKPILLIQGFGEPDAPFC